MRVYSCATPAKLHVCEAWANAHNWKLVTTEHPQYALGDCAIWGLMRGAKVLRQACRLSGYNYYALDNGYFRRMKYFRVTRNGYTQTLLVDRPSDRWDRLHIKMYPPKKGGVIMLAESSDWCFRYFGIPHWTAQTMAELRKYTDRKILVRRKELYKEIEDDEFKNVHCVVTHSSGIALDALLHGIPAIVTGPGAASAICPGDLSLVEGIKLPDNREQLFRSLAYAQFKTNEFGIAKEIVDELDAKYDHL